MSGSVVRIRIHKVAKYGSNFGSGYPRLLLTLPEFEIDGGGPAVGLGQHGMLLHLTLIHQCDCQLIITRAGDSLIGFLSESLFFSEKMSDLLKKKQRFAQCFGSA